VGSGAGAEDGSEGPGSVEPSGTWDALEAGEALGCGVADGVDPPPQPTIVARSATVSDR
jgi:hypothetical protein